MNYPIMSFSACRGEFSISTDAAAFDRGCVFAMLAKTYWARSRPREVVEKSLRHSLCFGLFSGNRQIGLARVITDYSTFAYLADVIVDDPYRGRGLGKWLVETIMTHPELCKLRRWMLLTEDAHDLYRQFGFEVVSRPENVMEKLQDYPAQA